MGVLLTSTAIIWADANTIFKSVDKGLTWTEEPCAIGVIMSLTRASNGDIVAAGIDTSGKVRTARQKSNETSWQRLETAVPLSSPATYAEAVMQLGYPSRDGVLVTARTRDGDSGAWACDWSGTQWSRIDTGNRVNQGAGISAQQTNTGIVADEGSGITYICDQDSIVRVRGYGSLSERITLPTNLKDPKILWFAPTFLDAGPGSISPVNLIVGVDTDGDGKIEVILKVRDTLVFSVAGVKASFLSVSPSSAVVNWNPVEGALNYGIFVSQTKQTNYYTATSDPGIIVKYNPGDTMAWINGLTAQSYYITVWATYPVTSFYGFVRLTSS
jgi:hypothetical protein